MPKGSANDRNEEEEFAGRTAMLNETVNTEAFSSPKSDLITSSPHAGSVHANERNADIISVSLTNDYSLRTILKFKPLDVNGDGKISVFSTCIGRDNPSTELYCQ